MQNQILKNWQTVKAVDVCSKVTDGTHDTPQRLSSSPHPLITSKQLKQGVIEATDYFISDADFNEVNKRSKVDQWDVLFGMIGTVGDTVIVRNENPQFAIKNIGLLKTGGNENLAKWLYYYFKSPDGKAYIKSSQRGTSQGFLPLESLREFPIIIPEDKDQMAKIVCIICAFDDKIDINNKIAKTLEEMAQALFKEWFVHFRFPGHEKVKMVDSPLGKIPEGWEIKKIKDFGLVVTGKTPSKERSEYYGDYMPFIKTPDMHGSTFCIKTGESLSEGGVDSQKNKILPANSICVSCIGTAGVVTITTQASQTNQQINSVVLKDQVDREFLFFVLRGLENTINMYGANGATMVNLNKSKFESLQIIYPPADLVNSFHTIVYPMFELIKNLQFKNLSLYQIRDLLLPKLMRGEIRV